MGCVTPALAVAAPSSLQPANAVTDLLVDSNLHPFHTQEWEAAIGIDFGSFSVRHYFGVVAPLIPLASAFGRSFAPCDAFAPAGTSSSCVGVWQQDAVHIIANECVDAGHGQHSARVNLSGGSPAAGQGPVSGSWRHHLPPSSRLLTDMDVALHLPMWPSPTAGASSATLPGTTCP